MSRYLNKTQWKLLTSMGETVWGSVWESMWESCLGELWWASCRGLCGRDCLWGAGGELGGCRWSCVGDCVGEHVGELFGGAVE